MEIISNPDRGDPAARGEPPQIRTRSSAGWPWLAIPAGLLVLHAFQTSLLIHHPWILALVLGLVAGSSLLRGRLVLTALSTASALGLLLSSHSLVTGLAVGVGAFAILITLFLGIGVLLRNQ